MKIKTQITEAFEFLNKHSGCLNERQLELLKGLRKYYREHKELTERQTQMLLEIQNYAV